MTTEPFENFCSFVLQFPDPTFSILNVTELDPAAITVYPNPNDGLFSIDVNDNHIKFADITVMSLDGKIVHSNRSTASSTSVDLRDLSSGLYLVKVQTNMGVHFQKINIK